VATGERAFPVNTTDRATARAAASGGTNVQVSKTQSTKGYTQLPVIVQPPEWVVQDYYRDGSSAAYLPRSIDSFADAVNAPASIRVYGSDKEGEPERDFIPAYTKFILTGTQESHQERTQIVETFSDFYVFFYGEKPPIYTYNGLLINSKNINWVADFMYYYDNHIRGTKCVESKTRLILTYGGRQVEGYILSFGMQTQAETENGVPITFQAIITKKNQIGFSDDFGLSKRKGKGEEDATLRKMLEAVAGKTGKGSSAIASSNAFNEAKSVMTLGKSPASPIAV
jgi:hypothetical protein